MAEELENQAPITYLVKTVKGVRRNIIYYDSDIFSDKIILSASLVIGDDDLPFDEHYNTIHDENNGSAGTNFQPIEDIAITIFPKPTKTSIIGPLRILEGSTTEYYIDSNYDTVGDFTYDWQILEGDAIFTSTGNNTSLDAGKNVDITFPTSATTRLRLRISNPAGCYRDIIKFLYPGLLTRKMLVVRNSYY